MHSDRAARAPRGAAAAAGRGLGAVARGAPPLSRLARASGSRCALPGQPDPVDRPRGVRGALRRARPRAAARHRRTASASSSTVSFAGEINLSAVQRGPFQIAYVGYWIDEACAGKGYVPEALVAVLRFAFDELPCTGCRSRSSPATRRAAASPRSSVYAEGTAERYLQINGVWEDHCATRSPSRSGSNDAPNSSWDWVDDR